jgi:hypothetical protein
MDTEDEFSPSRDLPDVIVLWPETDDELKMKTTMDSSEKIQLCALMPRKQLR